MKRKKTSWSIAVCLSAIAGLIIAQDQTAYRVQASGSGRPAVAAAGFLDVKSFGAKGDGKTLDTPAINKAITGAAAAGCGTVFFPAGNYLSVSIHLKSNIALSLDQGATIVAAAPAPGVAYDLPEPNQWDAWQ